MLKKNITYTDFNGTRRKEDFYFHLRPSKMIHKEVMYVNEEDSEATYSQTLEMVKESNDRREIFRLFTDMLKMSYGEKTADGKKFLQTDDIWKNFEDSAAYDAFMIELMTDSDAASEFVQGVLPDRETMERFERMRNQDQLEFDA